MAGFKKLTSLLKQAFASTESYLLVVQEASFSVLRRLKPTSSEKKYRYLSWPQMRKMDTGSNPLRPGLNEETVADKNEEVAQPPMGFFHYILGWLSFPLSHCINPCQACWSRPLSRCGPLPCNYCNNTAAEFFSKSQCFSSIVTLLLPILLVFCLLWRYYDDSLSKLLRLFEDMEEGLALALFVVMFTIASLPLVWGYVVLNLAAGYRYGIVGGVIVVMSSVTVGLTLTHKLSRFFCAKCIVNILRKQAKWEQIESILNVLNGPSGLKVIALTRLTPIPFGLQNGIFSLSSVKTRHYVVASSIGLFPTQVLNCYIGTTFHSVEDVFGEGGSIGSYILFFIQLGIGVALMMFVIKHAQNELSAALKQSIDTSQLDGGEPASHLQTDVSASQLSLSEIV